MKMKSFMCMIVVLCGFLAGSYGAAPGIEWEKVHDADKCFLYGLQVTSDAGCVAIGKKDNKPWVTKLNSNGDSLWSKTYDIGTPLTFGMHEGYVSGNYIFESPDHSFLCAGVGMHPVFFKLDENGNLLKEKERTTLGHIVVDMFQANDGGVYHIQEITTGREWKIIRYDTNLETMWEKPYPNDFFGGDTNETIYDITQAANNDLILLGKTDYGGFVARTDENFVTKWAKPVPTNIGHVLSEKPNGNVAVLCRFENNGADEIRYVSLTSSGDLISSTTKEYTLERGITVKEMPSGGYVAWVDNTGNTLTKMDDAFNRVWTKELPLFASDDISSYRDGSIYYGGSNSTYTTTTIGKLEPPPTPAITIRNLTDGAAFYTSEEIVLDVSIVAATIVNVKYYAGGNLIGTVSNGVYKSAACDRKKQTTTNSPYVFVWKNPPVGEHAITAVAAISGNRSVTSPMVTITVKSTASVKMNRMKTPSIIYNDHTLSVHSNMPYTVRIFSLHGQLRFTASGECPRQYNLKALADMPNGLFICQIRVGQKLFCGKVLTHRR